MRYPLTAFLLLLSCVYAAGQQPAVPLKTPPAASVAAPPAASEPEVVAVARPSDAVDLVAENLAEITDAIAPFKRYVWIPAHGTREWPGATNYGVNTAISKSSVIQQPLVFGNGTMLRYDLRLLAPDAETLVWLTELWERLAINEPYFHVTEGKAPAFAQHLNAEKCKAILARTKSAAPIVRADWFMIKVLSTLKGGMYYDFMGYEKSQPGPKGKSAKQLILESIGANENDSKNKGGDQRKAMFFSGVTGKPRLVEIFRGRGGRQSEGRVFLTSDIGDDDIRPNQHPMLNLLNFKFKAQELIFELPNGLHGFALFNAKGDLQASVPDDVAHDGTIPFPHTDRLECAIACIRCHGPSDGLQPVRNDVAVLFEQKDKLSPTVFDDLSNKRLNTFEVLDLIAGKYAGADSFDKKLTRGRDDYNDAIHKATGGVTKGEDSITKQSAAVLAAMFAAYRYPSILDGQVDAQRAALDLGYRCSKEAALPTIKRLLAPPPNGRDDPRILSLKQGLNITINDWEAVYSDAALRAQLNAEIEAEEIAKQKKK